MSLKLTKAIISPPFGTYINVKWATSVKGTWTAIPRKGSRILRALKTFRKVKGGWVNQIGLINKGVRQYNFSNPDNIYSVAAIDHEIEWLMMLDKIPCHTKVEMNVSCPNAHMAMPSTETFYKYSRRYPLVIVKLPPKYSDAVWIIESASNGGITTFHCGNTIPTTQGGMSGTPLKQISLITIEQIKRDFPDVQIIGGGGIYDPQDVKDYRNAGANYFSLATVFFTPWKVSAVKKEIYRE